MTAEMKVVKTGKDGEEDGLFGPAGTTSAGFPVVGDWRIDYVTHIC